MPIQSPKPRMTAALTAALLLAVPAAGLGIIMPATGLAAPSHHHHATAHTGKHTPAHPSAHHLPTHPVATRHHHTGRKLAIGAAAGAAGAAAAHPIAHADPVPPVQTPAPLPPPPGTDPNKGSNTGLPVPRFAALRADQVYMRVGPGERYPIAWVYHRRGLPVEIEREFDVWRLVEDADGQKGWVHQATLVGQRTFVIPGLPPEGAQAEAGQASEKAGDVIGRADARIVGHVADAQDARALPGVTLMFASASSQSDVIAALRPGTVGTLKQCPDSADKNAGWCRVVIKGYSGWLPRRVVWGLLPDETITTP